jgi:hypothetical protein
MAPGSSQDAPATVETPPPPPAPDGAVVYALVASRPLPCVDPAKTIKQVIFSPQQLTRFNRCIRRWRHWFTPGYWTGVALGVCTLFAPARIGVWCAVVSMPLQLIPSAVSLLAMRFDMAVLVVRGYEFWYLTLSNVAVSTLISFSFNDARFLVMVGASVAFETALLLDANHRASRLVSIATVLGALTNVAYLACAALGVIEYGRDLRLARYKHRILYADDVTANLIVTLVLLLVRNGVRKFSHTTADKRLVQCITYRCTVALVARVTPTQSRRMSSQLRLASSTTPALSQVNHTANGARQLIPLEFVRDSLRYSATNILLPRRLRVQIPLWIVGISSRLLHAVAWISLGSWILAAVAADPSLARTASVVSLCGVCVVCSSYLALAQRQLLSRLVTSFDFVFLSVQFTIAHFCLADILQWSSSRVLIVLSSWLWTHWVLLLDAVLPVHKSPPCLHFRPRVASAVLLLFVIEQLLVSVAIVFLDHIDDPRLQLDDRVIFTLTLHGRVRQLRIVPLLFGRMVTTLSWSLRLLWRLRDRRADNECLLLQGRVQYENSAAFSTFTTTIASMRWLRRQTQVAPTAPRDG